MARVLHVGSLRYLHLFERNHLLDQQVESGELHGQRPIPRVLGADWIFVLHPDRYVFFISPPPKVARYEMI